MTRSRRMALRLALVAIALLATDRLLARFVLADGLFLGRPVAPFDPPLFSRSQREALRRLEEKLASAQVTTLKFDPELGWCNRPDSGFGEYRYDWAGARIGTQPLAGEKAPGVRRIVAVGCSMTHGEEVRAEEAWCARLDALLPAVEVANLAVAAFGIDQALLRLRRDGWILAPDEVWLGIMPQAALRVTTCFRPLLDHWSSDVAFKPRFELGPRAELVLRPNPARSVEDVPRLLRDQSAFLEALGSDTWIARARLAYAPRGSSWTHSSFAARLALTVWERSGREFARCFDEEDEIGRLYTAIVRAMAAECSQRGVAFRIILLPGPDDLRARARDARGYWDEWAALRRAEGLSTVDVSESLLSYGVPFERLFASEGHYAPQTNDRLARELAPIVFP